MAIKYLIYCVLKKIIFLITKNYDKYLNRNNNKKNLSQESSVTLTFEPSSTKELHNKNSRTRSNPSDQSLNLKFKYFESQINSINFQCILPLKKQRHSQPLNNKHQNRSEGTPQTLLDPSIPPPRVLIFSGRLLKPLPRQSPANYKALPLLIPSAEAEEEDGKKRGTLLELFPAIYICSRKSNFPLFPENKKK